MKSGKPKRNYGVDLLRIIAMVFVVALHQMLLSGGLNTERGDVFATYWLIEAVAVCAVNVFALISGYVSYREEPRQRKLSSVLDLWLAAVFYGLVIALIALLVYPAEVSWMTIVKQFLPLSTDAHWYLTAYVGLFFLMPLADIALAKMSNEAARRTMIAILIVFSLLGTVFGINFRLSGGYGVLWLLILYFVGGAMKKCQIGERVKSWKMWLGIAVAVLIAWAWRMCNVEIAPLGIRPDTLYDYTAPTIMAISMMLVICFSRFHFSQKIERMIAFCVPSVFAIYLINTNGFVWHHMLGWQEQFINNASLIWLVLTSLGFVIGFAIAAILVDKVRIGLFKLVRLDQLMKRIDDKIKL